MPLKQAMKAATGGAVSANGNYTGNSTANRAIAHGLGVVPKIVFIVDKTSVYFYEIIQGFASVGYWTNASAPVMGQEAVTAMDANNFYVGNSTAAYYQSANLNGDVYYWAAIG